MGAVAGEDKPRTPAANDKIGIGLIGCGGMGRVDLADFQSNTDVDIVAVCDVYEPNANRAAQMTSGRAKIFCDYRNLLDDRSIDAVVIATPDHWHALMTVQACESGKDVYVEKPTSHNVREGRLMVEAARRLKRVVDVGIQQRSGSHFQRAVQAVQEGRIGSYGVMLYGTKGTLFIDRAGYRITPQMTMQREQTAQTFRESYDDLQGAGLYFTGDSVGERGSTSIQHRPHVRNFLDCVKSRQRPAGDIEIGHASTATCLIGNIALRTGLKLHWDGRNERFTNSADANRMLTRAYRPPWRLSGLEL